MASLDVVAAFIQNNEYNSWIVVRESEGGSDQFGTDPSTGKPIRVHGPFQLDRLKPEMYVPISFNDLRARIDELTAPIDDRLYPYQPEGRKLLCDVLEAIDEADAQAFWLDADPWDKELMSEVAVHSAFHEFLIVERERELLHMLIYMAE